MAPLGLGRRTGSGDSRNGLCGLVQAGRTWNEEFSSHMESEGLPAIPKNRAVHVQRSSDRQEFVAAG